MSREAQPQKSSKDSQQAMREADAHTAKTNSHDAVPGDDTAHAHSQAAHPKSSFEDHLPPQGNQPANIQPNRKEPPQEVSRSGKGHRGE
ncbi:MAG: hypothetical protein NVSMB3_09910 [Acidobacteriaceae bacterium]